ncbi:hypothetical protein ABT160_09885, partial [Streptomyces sp. NPDC001941]
MRRVLRAAATGLAVLGLTVVSPGPAGAAPAAAPEAGARQSAGGDLPAGWRLGARGDLEWVAPRRLHPGDARVEFRDGAKLLGIPTADPDGRTFRARLGAPPRPGADLRVVAGGPRRVAPPPPPTADRPCSALTHRQATKPG